jgi:hypothetical protein
LRARSSQRSTSSIDLVILGMLVLAVATVYAVYSLRVATFQVDEEGYLQLARYIAAHFPGALWQSGIYSRGIQRLDPIVLAVPFALMRGPGVFELAHVIQCLLFASTALPVFLLACGAGLGRLACLLAAALVIVVPWAVVSTSFLSESAAYPAYAWALYAVWLAAARPSPSHEALALIAIFVAALSRTALLALVPLLPLAVILQAWGWELAGIGPMRRIRVLPARLWSHHRLVSAIVGAAIVLYIANVLGLLPGRGLSSLTGFYGLPHVEPLGLLLDRYRYYLSRAVAGMGFVTLAIGLPWAVIALARPRDGARHALAAVCVLGILCTLLSLLQATPDERYVMYAAIPIALMFTAGLARPSWIGVLAGAIVVVLLIDSVTWPALANLYDYFTYPAAIFYQRVLLGHASLLPAPLIHLAPDRLVEVAIVLVALAWALLGRNARTARPATVVLVIGVLALGAAQTLYALDKYVTGAGAGADAAERSWVDQHVPGGARVAALAVSLGQTPDYLPIWRTVEFWNTSIQATAFFGSPGAAPEPLRGEQLKLRVQSPSGLVSALNGPGSAHVVAVPRYLLVPRQGTMPLGFETEEVSQDPSLLLDLIRLREPARLEWQLTGTSAEGFMVPGHTAEAIVYDGALHTGRTCVTLTLVAPPGFAGRWRYVIESARRPVHRGALAAEETLTFILPVHPDASTNSPIGRISIHVDGSVPYPGGSVVSARVVNFGLSECSGHRI